MPKLYELAYEFTGSSEYFFNRREAERVQTHVMREEEGASRLVVHEDAAKFIENMEQTKDDVIETLEVSVRELARILTDHGINIVYSLEPKELKKTVMRLGIEDLIVLEER